jgi:hypothetical protein
MAKVVDKGVAPVVEEKKKDESSGRALVIYAGLDGGLRVEGHEQFNIVELYRVSKWFYATTMRALDGGE